jgi:hypothetical protein
MISRKYSFQKLLLLLHRNNVVDAAASNIDGFLCSDACALYLSLIHLIGTKRAYLHLEKPKLPEVWSHIWSHINNVLDAAAASLDGFLWSGTCVSSTQLNRVHGVNRAYSHLETLLLQDVFLPKLTHHRRKTMCLVLLLLTCVVLFERYTCFFSFEE